MDVFTSKNKAILVLTVTDILNPETTASNLKLSKLFCDIIYIPKEVKEQYLIQPYVRDVINAYLKKKGKIFYYE